jgi:DNA-binding LytR/AlgR family response regulator
MNHTMTFHLTTGKKLTTMVLRESFAQLTECYLQDFRFLKPHASFVLNMDHVQIITPKEFEMLDGGIVPISRRAYAAARKRFTEYILARHGGMAL